MTTENITNSFTTTRNKGVTLKFANGWIISVQWGPGNYCDNYDKDFSLPMQTAFWSSQTAECAVYNPHGRMVRLTPQDSVQGHMTSDAVAALMQAVATGTFEEAEQETSDEEF